MTDSFQAQVISLLNNNKNTWHWGAEESDGWRPVLSNVTILADGGTEAPWHWGIMGIFVLLHFQDATVTGKRWLQSVITTQKVGVYAANVNFYIVFFKNTFCSNWFFNCKVFALDIWAWNMITLVCVTKKREKKKAVVEKWEKKPTLSLCCRLSSKSNLFWLLKSGNNGKDKMCRF